MWYSLARDCQDSFQNTVVTLLPEQSFHWGNLPYPPRLPNPHPFQNRAATLSLGKPSPEGADLVTHTCIREIFQQLEQNCNTICSAVSFSAILSILTAPSHLSVKDVLLLWSQRFSRWPRTTVNILKLIKNSTVPLLPLGACSDLRRLHFDAFPGRNAFVVLSFNL